jgi:hypothetical protein
MAGKYFPTIEITFSPALWSAKYGMDFSSAADWQDRIRDTHLDLALVDACVSQILEDAAPLERITYIRAIEVGPELSDESVRLLMTAHERLAS